MLIQQTSRDAYESVNRGNIPIRNQILDLFELVRFNKTVPNWTCDELECVLDGLHQTVSSSIRSLVKEGLVRNSGLKSGYPLGLTQVQHQPLGVEYILRTSKQGLHQPL